MVIHYSLGVISGKISKQKNVYSMISYSLSKYLGDHPCQTSKNSAHTNTLH